MSSRTKRYWTQPDLENLNQILEDEPVYAERIKHLEEAHRAIDKQLHEMEKHPHVEESKVAEMKKKKLQLKDQIRDLIERSEKEAND